MITLTQHGESIKEIELIFISTVRLRSKKVHNKVYSSM